jgi:hypothetical protein
MLRVELQRDKMQIGLEHNGPAETISHPRVTDQIEAVLKMHRHCVYDIDTAVVDLVYVLMLCRVVSEQHSLTLIAASTWPLLGGRYANLDVYHALLFGICDHIQPAAFYLRNRHSLVRLSNGVSSLMQDAAMSLISPPDPLLDVLAVLQVLHVSGDGYARVLAKLAELKVLDEIHIDHIVVEPIKVRARMLVVKEFPREDDRTAMRKTIRLADIEILKLDGSVGMTPSDMLINHNVHTVLFEAYSKMDRHRFPSMHTLHIGGKSPNIDHLLYPKLRRVVLCRFGPQSFGTVLLQVPTLCRVPEPCSHGSHHPKDFPREPIVQLHAPHLMPIGAWLPRTHAGFGFQWNTLVGAMLLAVDRLQSDNTIPRVDPAAFEYVIRAANLRVDGEK